jgi:LysM repeat protein
MVAIAHPDVRPRHLRLVTEAVAAAEMTAQRRHDVAIVRRRLVAVGVVVALLVALGVLLGRAGGTPSLGTGETGQRVVEGRAVPLPVASKVYVVQSGDTLWRIARVLQPEGDVRPLVYQLERTRHGAPLRVGERIALP